MSPAGRPKKPDSDVKRERIYIRVTESERKEIVDCAEKHGMTISGAILEGVRLLSKKKPK